MSKQDFDVYLARASNLSQRYRDEATNKPSQAMDSLILTASRCTPVNVAQAEPVSWFKRWRIPLSIAAVMMLSVGVTLRVVMQEAKQSSPPGYALPKEESATLPSIAKPAETKPMGESSVGTVSGGVAASSAADAPQMPANLASKKDQNAEREKEIVIDEPASNVVPAAPQDKAAVPMPLPAPSTRAAPRQEALERQSGSGSSSNDLAKLKSAPKSEQDSPMAEPTKRDDEALSRPRETAAPDAKDNEMRPASAAVPQAFPSEGPRLPEGHSPIVDGKTYRAEKSNASEAVEKKVSSGADAIIDNIEDAPEAWLRHVAELRRLGRNDEANAELERFRKRYPDYNAPVVR